ncbi:MAG: type II secretion system protein GspM [Burkholderiaceae bacterium]
MNASSLTSLRPALVGVLLLALVLTPLAVGGWYIYHKHRWAEARMAELEPRYARLQGLREQASDWTSGLEAVRALHAKLVYPASQDATQTGNVAQQRVRDLFTAAGLTVVSSQVMPAKTDKFHDRITIVVRAEGEAAAFYAALSALDSVRPVIIVNDVDAQVAGGLLNGNPAVAPRLTTQFNLTVMRGQ